MNEKECEELLEEVKNLRKQISQLLIRLECYLLRTCVLDEEELEVWLRRWKKGINIDEWVEKHKEEIKSISNSETFRKHEISPQDATLHFCMKLADMATYLASKSLLGSCECGGQLQLLVKDNTVYLTCAKCGRWLWQGLKHE